MNQVRAGDIYAKNGFDFYVQFIEKGTAYGVKYYSSERSVENFSECTQGYWLYRLPVSDLLAYKAELIREKAQCP